MKVIPPLLKEGVKLKKTSVVKLNEGKINISYVGNFYPAIREPYALISLWEAMLGADPTLRDLATLHIFGNIDRFPMAFSSNRELEHTCVFHGNVDHSLVGQIINQSQVLINLGNTTSYQLPSKIVEYAASGKPIINICITQEDSSRHFLRNYPLAMNVMMNEKTGLRSIGELIRFIKENHAAKMAEAPLEAFIKPYRAEPIADQYLALVQNSLAGVP